VRNWHHLVEFCFLDDMIEMDLVICTSVYAEDPTEDQNQDRCRHRRRSWDG